MPIPYDPSNLPASVQQARVAARAALTMGEAARIYVRALDAAGIARPVIN